MNFVKSSFAQVGGGSIEANLGGGWPYTNLGDLVRVLLVTAILGAGLFSFALLLLGGFQYITSQGDKIAVDKAQKTITYAIIGLVIIVGSYSIARVIETVFGVSIVSGITWPSPGGV